MWILIIINMLAQKYIETQRREIRQLIRFRSHLPVLKTNAGLPEESIAEFQAKINIRISQCEINILEHQKH